MKFKISTLLLVTLIASVALATWSSNREFQKRWERYTELSLPKSQWHSRGFASPELLTDLDPDFVDFRTRIDHTRDAWWTIWRTPSTNTLLDTHIEKFELVKQSLSKEMEVFLYRNMPLDWAMEHDTEFEVYQPKSQANSWAEGLNPIIPIGKPFEDEIRDSLSQPSFAPDYCTFLLHDFENSVIYFYTANPGPRGARVSSPP